MDVFKPLIYKHITKGDMKRYFYLFFFFQTCQRSHGKWQTLDQSPWFSIWFVFVPVLRLLCNQMGKSL